MIDKQYTARIKSKGPLWFSFFFFFIHFLLDHLIFSQTNGLRNLTHLLRKYTNRVSDQQALLNNAKRMAHICIIILIKHRHEYVCIYIYINKRLGMIVLIGG